MSTRNDIFDAIVDKLTEIKTSDSYAASPKHVVPYIENHQTKYKGQTPVLMVLDEGNEVVVAEDGTHKKLAFNISLKYFISGWNWDNVQLEINDFIESVHRLIELKETIHADVASFKFVEVKKSGWKNDSKEAWSDFLLEVKYWRSKALTESAGSDVHGDSYIATARTKLVAELNALKTTLSSSDPTFSYVYSKHDTAKVQLNAVSVDFVLNDPKDIGANDYSVMNNLDFSIRVHTGYTDDFIDGIEVSNLLNSISNKLKANLGLGDNYRIMDVYDYATNEVFEESDTIGGKLMVTIQKDTIHTQE